MKTIKTIKILVTVFALAFLCQQEAFALFDLSATSARGGSSVTFGVEKVSGTTEEARVSVMVSTDVNVKYQVYQVFPEPLRRDDGKVLQAKHMVFYTVSGSNARGTLMSDSPTYAAGMKQALYQSDAQGTADAFDIVYALNVSDDIQPGNYRGRVTYILEPQSSGEAKRQVTLNLYAYVNSSADLVVSVSPEGGKMLRLGRAGQEKNVLVQVTAPTKTGYQIRQVIGESLLSQGRRRLSDEQLTYTARKVQGAGAIKTSTGSFKDVDRIIYADMTGQKAEILLSFNLADSQIPAGMYTTNIGYILEPLGGGKILKENIQFVLNIEPIFDISATTEGGIDFVKFRDLKPGAEPKITKVHLKVDTNKGKPYQLSQILSNPLLSREGKKIPEENFTVETTGGALSGKVMIAGGAPVREGVTVLYVSDQGGDPVELELVYKIKVTSAVEAGDYASQLKYSISEL